MNPKSIFRIVGILICFSLVIIWLSPRPVLSFSSCRNDTTLYSYQICLYEDRTLQIHARETPEYKKFFAKRHSDTVLLSENDYQFLINYADQLIANPTYVNNTFQSAVQDQIHHQKTAPNIICRFMYLFHLEYCGNKMIMSYSLASDDEDLDRFFITMHDLESNLFLHSPFVPLTSGFDYSDRYWFEKLFDTYVSYLH